MLLALQHSSSCYSVRTETRPRTQTHLLADTRASVGICVCVLGCHLLCEIMHALRAGPLSPSSFVTTSSSAYGARLSSLKPGYTPLWRHGQLMEPTGSSKAISMRQRGKVRGWKGRKWGERGKVDAQTTICEHSANCADSAGTTMTPDGTMWWK